MKASAEFILYIGSAYIVASLMYLIGVVDFSLNVLFSANAAIAFISIGQIFRFFKQDRATYLFNYAAVICLLVIPFSVLPEIIPTDVLDHLTTFLTILSYGLVFVLLFFNNYRDEQIEEKDALLMDIKNTFERSQKRTKTVDEGIERIEKGYDALASEHLRLLTRLDRYEQKYGALDSDDPTHADPSEPSATDKEEAPTMLTLEETDEGKGTQSHATDDTDGETDATDDTDGETARS